MDMLRIAYCLKRRVSITVAVNFLLLILTFPPFGLRCDVEMCN